VEPAKPEEVVSAPPVEPALETPTIAPQESTPAGPPRKGWWQRLTNS
jgi:hypothetical protein